MDIIRLLVARQQLYILLVHVRARALLKRHTSGTVCSAMLPHACFPLVDFGVAWDDAVFLSIALGSFRGNVCVGHVDVFVCVVKRVGGLERGVLRSAMEGRRHLSPRVNIPSNFYIDSSMNAILKPGLSFDFKMPMRLSADLKH